MLKPKFEDAIDSAKQLIENNITLGKGSKKKNLESSRFSGGVGLKKSIFQI